MDLDVLPETGPLREVFDMCCEATWAIGRIWNEWAELGALEPESRFADDVAYSFLLSLPGKMPPDDAARMTRTRRRVAGRPIFSILLGCIAGTLVHEEAAMRKARSGDMESAQLHIAECYRFAGMAQGAWFFLRTMGDARTPSEMARAAANARHRRTNAIKGNFLEWYEENRSAYRSKDAAAFAGATRFPLAFKTLRNLLNGR